MSRLTLVSVYNNEKYINPNLYTYLRELKKHSDKLVVLVNHSKIDSKELLRLQSITKDIEWVENYGYDFGMFNAYFTQHPTYIREYNKILLTNDSILIYKPLTDIFRELDTTSIEYMGIQDGYMNYKYIENYIKSFKKINKDYNSLYKDGRHIESRFLQLQGEAKEFLVDLIRNGIPQEKTIIILEYEIKRSQIAREKYTTGVIYKTDNDLIKKDGVNMCYQYPILNIKKGSPFIKKDFRNYGFKSSFKPAIDCLSTMIYKHGTQQTS